MVCLGSYISRQSEHKLATYRCPLGTHTEYVCDCRLLSGSFRGWSQAADKLCQQTLADGYEELAGQVGAMKAENERLRRDNERFVRLIDSGEWGRGRVAELTQAGEPSHALPWGDVPELMPAVGC